MSYVNLLVFNFFHKNNGPVKENINEYVLLMNKRKQICYNVLHEFQKIFKRNYNTYIYCFDLLVKNLRI